MTEATPEQIVAFLTGAQAVSDIVERLRRANVTPFDCSLHDEAADEIERLNDVVATLRALRALDAAEIDRLRAALQQLASMAEGGARAYDDNELRDLLIEMDNQARRALEPKP